MRDRVIEVIALATCVAATLTACEDVVTEGDLGPRPDYSCETYVGNLTVAEERRDGYDRELFAADYDRDALLAESLDEHGGYLSTYDGQLYDDPDAVDVDHTVALAEAWDSGAYDWSQEVRDAFSEDPWNLTLLTRGVNRGEKGDGDAADWLPTGGDDAVGEYVIRYVVTKVRWGMTVDEEERDVLLEIADGKTCGAV